MKTIDELWYGNVSPFEQCTRGDKRLKELLKLVARNREELDSTLTDKQKETLEKFEECMNEMHSITERDAFSYWTLWDMTYNDIKVEVKETSYYHSFNEKGKYSNYRSFGIGMAHGSYDQAQSGNTEYKRQSDVYIFCLNTGYTAEESYPLNLNNWEFYIVPTSVIDEKCGKNKTITLSRIKNMGYTPKRYNEIKETIDSLNLRGN